MPPIAILLVAVSALTHASWNLICKSRQPSGAFFLISTGASILAMSPLTLCFLPLIPRLPVRMLVLLLSTGIVQAAYYVSLGNAYRLSEISVAYPLARAVPVLLVPLVTTILGLGTPLGTGAMTGMVMVCTGCVILPLPSFRGFRASSLPRQGLLYILGAAAATTAYSIIDSEALKIFRETGLVGPLSAALIYVAWENLMIEVFLFGYVLLTPGERVAFHRFRTGMGWRMPAFSGVICTSGYALVLLAMMFAGNVSYIVSFRQLSIPLGAILGIILLREKPTRPKIAGIILISAGLLVVGLAE